ncbi:hypothetical protein [Microtetraspora malaysiensis]
MSGERSTVWKNSSAVHEIVRRERDGGFEFRDVVNERQEPR